jgi:hypothetical protein
MNKYDTKYILEYFRHTLDLLNNPHVQVWEAKLNLPVLFVKDGVMAYSGEFDIHIKGKLKELEP